MLILPTRPIYCCDVYAHTTKGIRIPQYPITAIECTRIRHMNVHIKAIYGPSGLTVAAPRIRHMSLHITFIYGPSGLTPAALCVIFPFVAVITFTIVRSYGVLTISMGHVTRMDVSTFINI